MPFHRVLPACFAEKKRGGGARSVRENDQHVSCQAFCDVAERFEYKSRQRTVFFACERSESQPSERLRHSARTARSSSDLFAGSSSMTQAARHARVDPKMDHAVRGRPNRMCQNSGDRRRQRSSTRASPVKTLQTCIVRKYCRIRKKGFQRNTGGSGDREDR